MSENSHEPRNVGLPYRPELERLIESMQASGRLGFCEALTEGLLGNERALSFLDTLACCGIPIYLHSTSLLLASDAMSPNLEVFRELDSAFAVSMVSGHFANGLTDFLDWEVFTRPAYNELTLRQVIGSIKRLEDSINMPVGVENIAYYGRPQHDPIDEVTFFRELAERLPGQVVFDISNFLTNCANSAAPRESISEVAGIPARYFHISGGRQMDGQYIDTHCDQIPQDHLSLLSAIAQSNQNVSVLYERDGRFSDRLEIECDLINILRAIEVPDQRHE